MAILVTAAVSVLICLYAAAFFVITMLPPNELVLRTMVGGPGGALLGG